MSTLSHCFRLPVRIARLSLIAALLAGCGSAPPTLVGTSLPVFTNTPTQSIDAVPTTDILSPTDVSVENAFRIIVAANCRSEPNENAAIVTNFVEGTVLELLGYSPDNNWVRVAALDVEAECWVYKELGNAEYYNFNAPMELTPALTGEPILFVSDNIANCRQGPGTLYTLESTVPANVSLTVEARNQDSSWVWVRPPETIRNCWVAVRQGALNGSLDDVPFQTAFTLDKTAQCREGPGTIYDVLTSYTKRWIMTVQGRSEAGDWLLVLQPNGQRKCWFSIAIGKVDGSLEPIPVMTVILLKTGAKCRLGPGMIYDTITTLPVDMALNVEGRSLGGSWLWVYEPELRNRCWIAAELGSVGAGLQSVQVAPPPASPSPVFMMTLAGQCRQSASVESPVLTSFAADKVVEIAGRSANNDWLYVNAPGLNYQCWVAVELGQVYGTLDELPVIPAP